MSLLPRYLATKLTEALPTKDGGVLRTIGDAITYMSALPKHRETKKRACDRKDSTPENGGRLLRCGISLRPMSAQGQSLHIDTVPTPGQCPLYPQ